jgi:hypothetical protein
VGVTNALDAMGREFDSMFLPALDQPAPDPLFIRDLRGWAGALVAGVLLWALLIGILIVLA